MRYTKYIKSVQQRWAEIKRVLKDTKHCKSSISERNFFSTKKGYFKYSNRSHNKMGN